MKKGRREDRSQPKTGNENWHETCSVHVGDDNVYTLLAGKPEGVGWRIILE